ncbi:hypothetical protein ACLOJK_007183 [Asimina triloba]
MDFDEKQRTNDDDGIPWKRKSKILGSVIRQIESDVCTKTSTKHVLQTQPHIRQGTDNVAIIGETVGLIRWAGDDDILPE